MGSVRPRWIHCPLGAGKTEGGFSRSGAYMLSVTTMAPPNLSLQLDSSACSQPHMIAAVDHTVRRSPRTARQASPDPKMQRSVPIPPITMGTRIPAK